MGRVVVIGAGVAGLSFANYVRERAPSRELVVLEASGRAGGNIRTLRRDGCVVELGPDAFLAMPGGAVSALCEAVGAAPLVAPAQAGRVLVAHRGALEAMPEGLAMGLPRSAAQMARTPLLSPLGKLRAGLDLVLPRNRAEAVSVGELVGRRLGREVKDRLVEPIVGGIYGGDVDELDAQVVMPGVAKVRGSLIRAMAAAPRSSGGPPLRAPEGGMDTLVDGLVRALADRIRLRAKVIELTRDGLGWRVRVEGREAIEAEELVLAVPPEAVRSLLQPLDADAAAAVGAFKLRAAMTVIVAFARGEWSSPEASGALIPRSVDEPLRAISAMSFIDRKWPQRVPDALSVLRLAVRPDRALGWMRDDDDAIVERALASLRSLLPVPAPRWTAVERYPEGTPQPTPGHVQRVATARERVSALGAITVLGAAWDGPGIAGCVAGAKREAERIATR